jgi:hypothetical protein
MEDDGSDREARRAPRSDGEAPAAAAQSAAVADPARHGRESQRRSGQKETERLRAELMEQRHQTEILQAEKRAAAAAATAAAMTMAATAAAAAAKGQRQKKDKKRRRRHASDSSDSGSDTGSDSARSSDTSGDSDSGNDADEDDSRLRKHRSEGKSSHIREHVRRKFAHAFPTDWKQVGLEAEARRLRSIQEAVRGLGKAGLSGKTTADAIVHLLSDVQHELRAYDNSAQDSTDKVVALERAVAAAVSKRINRKLGAALRKEGVLLVPSVGRRAKGYADKGRKVRGTEYVQDMAAAMAVVMGQQQQQGHQLGQGHAQQPQQLQAPAPSTLPPFTQQGLYTQQYNPMAATQQALAAAQQQGNYGNGYAGRGHDRRSCYVCGEPNHIASHCPKKGAAMGAATTAGSAGLSSVRDTRQMSHPLTGLGATNRHPFIGPGEASHHPLTGLDVRQGPRTGHGRESVADLELAVCRAVVYRGEPSSRPSEWRDQRPSGHAGEEHAGVDIMPKEAKVSDGPAQLAAARRIEQDNAQLHAEFLRDMSATHEQFNTIDPDEYELKWDKDDMGDARGAEDARDGRAPPAAGMPLRLAIDPNNTGVLGRSERGACLFCGRKGHRRGTCMIAPAVARMSEGDGRTGLQLEKERWVLALLARPTRPLNDMGPCKEESRLQAARRHLELGRLANERNPWMGSMKRRDKLRRALGYWWAVGADATVLSWIGFGVRLRFEREPQRVCFPNHRSYHEHVDHVEAEHQKHVAEGSFVEVDGSHVHVSNPLQVEVNAKGKRRMCSDDRYPNAFIADYDFTQEGLKEVAALVQRGWLMITTDVEQAYYQVPLHKDSQRYLAWSHNGKWYIPTIIVFGTKPAPFVFTKIMRPVLRFVRALGISGTNCIDDNLWAGPAAEMDETTAVVRLVFGTLGWVFNSKCVFEASTSAVYNGMWIDSAKYEMRAPDEKWEKARKLAWSIWFQARNGQQVLLKDLQKLTGVLHSIKLAVEGVSVWTRGIYADQAACVREWTTAGHVYAPRHARTYLSVVALEDVWFWSTRLSKPTRYNGQPIDGPGLVPVVVVHSDAGDLGYGMHARLEAGQLQPAWTTHGVLPEEMMGESSTAREIAGLMAAAEQQKDKLRGRRVRFVMDSYPAMRNLIRGGGPVEQLNELVRRWWHWCARHNVRPTFEWVPRERNTLADELSKVAAAALDLRAAAETQVREWLVRCGLPGVHAHVWQQVQLYAPRWDCISYRVQEMLRRREPACIVVPSWGGLPWVQMLRSNSPHRLTLGTAQEVLTAAPAGLGGVTMQAYVVAPRR